MSNTLVDATACLLQFKFVCCDKSYPLFFVIFLSFRILDSSPIIMSKLNFFLLTLFGLTWSSPIQPPSGITEPGDNFCSKFTRFHESLLKAGASNGQPCIDAQPICKYIRIPMYLCKGSFQKLSAKNIWNFPYVGGGLWSKFQMFFADNF